MSDSGRVRKQWQLQDGPRGTLRRLRCQLAEGGCTESQVAIARALLNEAKGDGTDAEEAARDAVEWLVKAARRGNSQATPLLQQCVRTGRGLDVNNYKEVLQCLNMSETELEARQAARTLFHEESLDGESISTGKLFQTLHRLQAGACEKDENPCCEPISDDIAGKCTVKFLSGEGKVYTEDQLLDMASEVVTGDNPECQMQRDLETEYFRKLTLRQKFLVEPGLTLRVSYVYLLERMSSWGTGTIRVLFVPGYQHFVALLFLHWIVTWETMLTVMPTVLFFVSFFTMVVSTSSMLCFRQRLRDLKQWSQLLRLVSCAFTKQKQRSQSLYMWHTLKPYINFLAAFLVMLFTYTLVPRVVIPTSCFTVVSFVLTVTTFVALNSCFDALVILSMSIQILLHFLPRILFALNPTEYGGDTMPCAGVILFGRCFRLHIGIPSLLYLITPVIFLFLGMRHNFKGFHRILVPHLVCIAWWQVTMLFVPDSSVYGLLKSLLILCVFLAIIPLLGIFCALVLGITIGQLAYGHFEELLRMLLLILLIVLPIILTKWRCQERPESRFSRWFRYICKMLLVISVFQFWVNLEPHTAKVMPKPTFISWKDYYTHCHKHAWDRDMVVQVEMQCVRLTGTYIVWEGDVELAHIVSVTNKIEPYTSMMPEYIQHHLRCWLGTPIVLPWVDKDLDECDLSNWNSYNFQLIVTMTAGLEKVHIYCLADHGFSEFFQKLTRGDHVRIRGRLTSGLGGANPVIRLNAVECVDCSESVRRAQSGVPFQLTQCIKFMTHFFFSPLLEFYDIFSI